LASKTARKSIESSNGLADAVDLALKKSKRCVSFHHSL
jgi:hypothetical protein